MGERGSQARRASWQAVALDLLRRHAGAEPRDPLEHVRDLGRVHASKLREKGLDGLYYAICDPGHRCQRLYQALCDRRIQETRDLVHELEHLAVEVLVLDENEASLRYDRGVSAGVTSTITLLVPPDALWKAQKVLYGRGYVQGGYDREAQQWVYVDYVRQLQDELASSKLWPFRAALEVEGIDAALLGEARDSAHFLVLDDVAHVSLTVEVRHALTPGVDAKAALQRSIAGVGFGRALARADQLWFSVSRYYHELATGTDRTLRALVWIAPLIADPDVDWSVFVRTAIDQKATSAHLYWLTFFRQLGARTVPAEVLHELRVHHDRSERNWGWQLEALFELEPSFPPGLGWGAYRG